MEGEQYKYVLDGALAPWDERGLGLEEFLSPIAVKVRPPGPGRRRDQLRRTPPPLQPPPKQRQRALFGGGQPVYLLDQPQPVLATLEPADGHEERSVFRALPRESENGVAFDPHATMAGLPVRTLNPKPMIPLACLAMGFGASLAAPKGSIFSHIGGARAAGRSETVTQVSVRGHSAVRVTAIMRCSRQAPRSLPRSGVGPVESRESARPGSVLRIQRILKGHKMETNTMLAIKRGVKDAYSSVSQKLSV
jgi:hypothetical protein